MNIKLTLGERLKDLRVERNLKLETLAEQTGLSKSALSKYESDDVTDLSIYAVTTLAEFYGVTTDYLLGVTENKKRPDAVLSDLHLSDGAVDVLRNGKFNHRLLCELIVHENFRRFMTDLEIYVDGYVSANIQNLNAGLEATRQMLKKKYAADENDLYMSTLKLGQIDEDEYFGRVLYDELVAILKNIKTEHRKDKTTSDGSMIDNLMKELEDAQKLEGSADEKKIRTALKAIGINYDKLTEDERKLIKKILYKTAMLKPGTLAGNRVKPEVVYQLLGGLPGVQVKQLGGEVDGISIGSAAKAVIIGVVQLHAGVAVGMERTAHHAMAVGLHAVHLSHLPNGDGGLDLLI